MTRLGWRVEVYGKQQKIVFDFIALMWFATTLLLALYMAFTFPNIALYGVLAVSLSIAGLVMSMFLGLVQLDLSMPRRLVEWFVWVLLSIVFILLTNVFVNFGDLPIRYNVSFEATFVFVIVMAIFEEVFWRQWLLPWLQRMTGTAASIVVTSGIWSVFHFSVYGMQPEALFIVFLSGLILNYVIISFRRISVTMTAHAAINALSMLPFMIGVIQ